MGIWRIGFFLAENADRNSTSTGGRGLGRKRDSLRKGPLRLQMLLLIFLLLALRAPTAICGEEAPPKNKEAGPAFSFLTWGRVLIATEQFSQAASYLEKEVENRPDSTEAYMLLGKAYWGMGRIKDARAAWEKAIALEPNSAPPG